MTAVRLTCPTRLVPAPTVPALVIPTAGPATVPFWPPEHYMANYTWSDGRHESAPSPWPTDGVLLLADQVMTLQAPPLPAGVPYVRWYLFPQNDDWFAVFDRYAEGLTPPAQQADVQQTQTITYSPDSGVSAWPYAGPPFLGTVAVLPGGWARTFFSVPDYRAGFYRLFPAIGNMLDAGHYVTIRVSIDGTEVAWMTAVAPPGGVWDTAYGENGSANQPFYLGMGVHEAALTVESDQPQGGTDPSGGWLVDPHPVWGVSLVFQSQQHVGYGFVGQASGPTLLVTHGGDGTWSAGRDGLTVPAGRVRLTIPEGKKVRLTIA